MRKSAGLDLSLKWKVLPRNELVINWGAGRMSPAMAGFDPQFPYFLMLLNS
jgi:hypothetical protein